MATLNRYTNKKRKQLLLSSELFNLLQIFCLFQIYPTVDGGIYDHLIADLKSERSFDQHDQHTLSQRSTVELHKFLTQLMLKSQEALPKSQYIIFSLFRQSLLTNGDYSEERGQSQSNFAGLAHQTTESGYQESLINNVFGDELLPREGKQTTYSFDSLIFCLHYFIDGCSDGMTISCLICTVEIC